MKTALLSILFCLTIATSYAQDWCHSGSTWHYYYVELGGEGYNEYTYVKDTSVVLTPCHMLSNTKYSAAYIGGGHYQLDTSQQLALYTYSSHDTVYFYYPIFGKWLPAYFFNAQVGDTIIIPNYAIHTNSDTSVTAVVDSAGSLLIDTAHLRYYVFHLTDTCALVYHFGGRVVERVGMIDNVITPFWHCITDDIYYSLCSYKDDSFALYKPDIACDHLPTGITDISSITFQLYPNPASDEIKISSNMDMTGAKLIMHDIEGRVVMDAILKSSDNTVKLSSLIDGIYLISISQGSRVTATGKLVIAH